MKIVHFALSNYFVDGFLYQENILSNQNKIDGHDVLVVASLEGFDSQYNQIIYESGEYMNENNIRVIRIPYNSIFQNRLLRKIRVYSRVWSILNDFQPDIIFFHGIAGWEIITIAKYKKKYPKVKFFADNHADFNNSAKNVMSYYLLHKGFYRIFYKLAEKQIDALFYTTLETKRFACEMYRAKKEKMQYLPLGGYPIIDDHFYFQKRKYVRMKYAIDSSEIVFITSGKFGLNKRIDELVSAFSKISSLNKIKLLIVGSLHNKMEQDIKEKISAISCIEFLGWKSSDELMDLFYASDVYIQLAGQTVSMQNALCCRCAVALYPYPSHLYLLHDASFYIECENDIIELCNQIVKDIDVLNKKKIECWNIATQKLDYRNIVNQYIQL